MGRPAPKIELPMADVSVIETLVELASKETGEAALRLARAISAVEEAQRTRALLTQYRDEYDSRLRQKLAVGASAKDIRNFQAFLARLDEALCGQDRVVSDAQRRVDSERSSWQAGERRRISYGTLVDRAHQEGRRKELRREQKQTDEVAARRVLMNAEAR